MQRAVSAAHTAPAARAISAVLETRRGLPSLAFEAARVAFVRWLISPASSPATEAIVVSVAAATHCGAG
jgi:hypothetical protein